MALPTKRWGNWTGTVRRFFNMDDPEPTRRAISLSVAPPDRDRRSPGARSRCSHDSYQDTDEHGHNLNSDHKESVEALKEQMQEAKRMYPGSKEWAKDEERLFEILYLRQDIPMLPSHWNIDFRGFPIPEEIFNTGLLYPPRIYAHSKAGSKEYTATAALTRLIDLTLDVRTMLESEVNSDDPPEPRTLRHRAAEHIKATLDDYLSWAARDGGYSNSRVLPNIIVEVVDAPDTQEGILSFMTTRMRALGRLQREFYREDRPQGFWKSVRPWVMATDSKKRKSLKKKRRVRNSKRKAPEKKVASPDMAWDELSDESTILETPMEHMAIGVKRRRIVRGSPSNDMDELGDYDQPMPSIELDTDSFMTSGIDCYPVTGEHPRTPQLTTLPIDFGPEPSHLKFSRKPPVVYGLYVMGTSVFLITMDSSKGDNGYVSFHVDINFADNHQSVWNALTVALAVCAARDELMLRLADFTPVSVDRCDSDPDA